MPHLQEYSLVKVYALIFTRISILTIMNKVLSIIFFLNITIAINGQTIADARNQVIGQTVTITGVATNGPELGPIRYIQDGTAGLPAYGSNLSSIQRGDSVTATGVLFEFSGLLELSPTTSYSILGQGTLPQPLLIPITSANESLEVNWYKLTMLPLYKVVFLPMEVAPFKLLMVQTH